MSVMMIPIGTRSMKLSVIARFVIRRGPGKRVSWLKPPVKFVSSLSVVFLRIQRLSVLLKVLSWNGMVLIISLLVRKPFLFLKLLSVNITRALKVVRVNRVRLLRVMIMLLFGGLKLVLLILTIRKPRFIRQRVRRRLILRLLRVVLILLRG